MLLTYLGIPSQLRKYEKYPMALTKVKSGMRTLGTGEVATANMATDPTNASNLSSGSVPSAQL